MAGATRGLAGRRRRRPSNVRHDGDEASLQETLGCPARFELARSVQGTDAPYTRFVESERVSWWSRIVLGAIFVGVGLATAFTVGEAMSSPGGWRGIGLSLLWVVPMIALMALSLRRERFVEPLIVLLTVTFGAGIVLAGLAGGSLWRFENHHGPIRAIVVLAMTGVLATLAVKHRRLGGVLMAGLALATLVSAVTGTHSAPLAVIGLPLLVAGILVVAVSHPLR